MIRNSYYKIYSTHILVILSLLVASRAFGHGPDYLSYKEIFSSSDVPLEPFFLFLRRINLLFFRGNIFIIYFVSAVIALALKFKFISFYAHNIILSFIFYICTFFFLHEYTQIRAAVAIGVFFTSLDDIIHHKLGPYIFKTAIAFLFHYSSVLMLVIYFYCNGLKIKQRDYLLFPWLVFIIDIFFSTMIKNMDIINTIVSDLSRQKTYLGSMALFLNQNMGHEDIGINVFNKVYLSILLICCFMYYFYNGFRKTEYESDYLLFKILSFTAFSFYLLLNFSLPVLAFRISEFFFPVISVVLPNMIIKVREKQLFFIFLCIYFFLLSYMLLSKIVF